jgi:hypothetical protein
VVGDVHIEVRPGVRRDHEEPEVFVILVRLSAEEHHPLPAVLRHLFFHQRLQVHADFFSDMLDDDRAPHIYCDLDQLFELRIVLLDDCQRSAVVILILEPGDALNLGIDE